MITQRSTSVGTAPGILDTGAATGAVIAAVATVTVDLTSDLFPVYFYDNGTQIDQQIPGFLATSTTFNWTPTTTAVTTTAPATTTTGSSSFGPSNGDIIAGILGGLGSPTERLRALIPVQTSRK